MDITKEGTLRITRNPSGEYEVYKYTPAYGYYGWEKATLEWAYVKSFVNEEQAEAYCRAKAQARDEAKDYGAKYF